ncbi:ABC transporter substrate-binding protein [Propionicicella superfundia]|uniref:ABC transporter substrate-binding protein n=1 Tax=Propionicicella superfundia TaxID=348582 RepID=UPI0004045863|nr:ABC transporter substrate-binding protein [Propionicicella superfundia]
MPRRRTRLSVAAALMATLLALTSACSAPATTPTTAAAEAAGFPVTIAHAFGETTIDSPPQRIVTWGWGAADAVLALGEVPVGIPKQTYGGDESGLLPWIKTKLADLGAETPTMLDSSTNEVPVQAVAALDPDVFLAPYSGLTQAEYDQLTGLGIKVVAYPETAWSTPWRDVVTIVGTALGQEEKAKAVLSDIDKAIAAEAAEHPEFADVTVAQVWDTSGNFYVYLPADPRVQFTEDLGFTSAPSVTALDTKEATFYYTLPYEKLDQLTSDVLVVYADSQTEMDAFLKSDRAKLLPQVAAGTVAQVVGQASVASVSPPTALSLTWGMDPYVEALAKAVEAKG